MNIEKGNIICLRKDYIEYYNGKSDLKIRNDKAVVKDIINDKVFPYVVTDHNNETHNIGNEDINFKATKNFRFTSAFINAFKPFKIYSELK